MALAALARKIFGSSNDRQVKKYRPIVEKINALEAETEKLNAEFGKTEHDLANYSFVYHRMIKDDLIYHNIKQLEYYNFLAEYDIHISRITSVNTLGKTQLRESIYANAK